MASVIDEWVYCTGGMILTGDYRSTVRRNCSRSTLSTSNPTWTVWYISRTSAATDQKIIAWAMARPSLKAVVKKAKYEVWAAGWGHVVVARVCVEMCWTFGLQFRGSAFNPLNSKLNPICHLLALLGAHHILHVSGLRVKDLFKDCQ